MNCACVSRDAAECLRRRCPPSRLDDHYEPDYLDEACECSCHGGYDESDEADDILQVDADEAER